MPATRFLLDDLEKDATKLADSIAHVSGSLKINLHAVCQTITQYLTHVDGCICVQYMLILDFLRCQLCYFAVNDDVRTIHRCTQAGC